MKATLTATSFLILTYFISLANTVSKETCLIVKGTVFSSNEKAAKAKVYLFDNYNNKIDSMETTVSGKFKFNLKKDTQYSITVSKPGYQQQLISFDTKLPSLVENKVYVLFEFEADIYLLKETEIHNSYYTDFPIAVVRYNNKEEVFTYDKTYTMFIKDAIKSTMMPMLSQQ